MSEEIRCKKCGLNSNEAQSKEQQKWEADYIKKNGLCSACALELEENKNDSD